MKKTSVSWFQSLPLVALFLPLGCGGTADSSETTDKNLELYSWWTNPGETDALAALLAEYEKQYPQTEVINATVDDVNNAQQQLQTRMNEGSPPDTFQAMGGADLMRWVVPDGSSDSAAKMEPLDELAAARDLASVVPPPVLEAMSHKGKIYGMPIGVHRFNLLYFNKKLFDKNGLEPPTSLDEFYSVSEVLKSKDIVPLALGSKEGWPLSVAVLDGILVAKGGVKFRNSYLTGHEAPDDPRMLDSLEEAKKMLSYTNADRDAQNWDEAAQMVVDGKAAMTIMGDWAKGFFLSQGMRSGIELGQIPIPGSGGVFVYLVDSFTLPKGAVDRQAAMNFLNLVGSESMQSIFNPIKGSTPPRTDAHLDLYDSLARENIQQFRSDTLASGASLLISSPEFLLEFDNTMKQFAVDGDVDAVHNMLANWYDLLE